jgi:hypothetical protein
MEEAGIEPATCRMQSDHSTPELHPLLLLGTYTRGFRVYIISSYQQNAIQ